jgi:oleate hydratase
LKILIVLTSHDRLGNTGKKTGFWLEELAAPYYVFIDAGADVTLASPKGGQPPLDPKSDEPDSQTESTQRFTQDAKAQRLISATEKLADIQVEAYDAVFYPGGHGPLWDLAEAPHSIALIESTLAAGKPLALVCHAPGVLRHAKAGDGSPLVAGKHVTGFSDSEESAAGLTDVVPFLVEDELKQLGGLYAKGPDWLSFVQTDGNLITGQNPASSAQAARLQLQMLIGKTKNNPTGNSPVFYLIGGGIASLAAAAFLIRDGDIKGHNIEIIDESARIGGSLDAAGNAKDGYSMRGGRMFESKYLCTFDLFSSIPTLDDSGTVTQEILQWNETIKTASKSRLFRDGHAIDAPDFGLSPQHIVTLERLGLEPEMMLGRSTIADQFDPSFFETNFWMMWCTTFAFQPWHSAVEFKRYLLRFTHMVSGFNSLSGIMRTVYNQYDSLVRPLRKWLEERGVRFAFDTRVTDIAFYHGLGGYGAECIRYEQSGLLGDRYVAECDFVIVTLGSMTEGSTLGSMDTAPTTDGKPSGGSWALWESMASHQSGFGKPSNFTDHVEQSKWTSFTVTLHEPTFFNLIRDMTGNVPGEGGLITFPKSSWLASIVLPHQPHFIGQPEDVYVFWGYGLRVDQPGDFVLKPMSACTGREIMTEVLGHLSIHADAAKILESCICIPCMMPFITSQFLPRGRGDRPDVIPEQSKNFALIGQYCELPDDVVFTVEYSIRSAQTAVYALLNLDRTPPPVYKGTHDVRVLLEAFAALHAAG